MQNAGSRPDRDVGQRLGATTSQNARKLNTPASNSGSTSSPNPIVKTPKPVDRRLPRTPANERKRPNKGCEPEPRIAHLQEELKKTKEQLITTESCKRRAQQEVEEARQQLAAMVAELEESQHQLRELSESEEARVQELRKISHERDREWQSEIEAFQKQYSMDSAALASAMNEIQKLKMQLDRVVQSEASQARHAESAHGEVQSLRVELTETLVLVERLKNQLNESREYEARAVEELTKAQREMEVAKTKEKELKLEHESFVESYNSLLLELEESKDRVKSLEELVASPKIDISNTRNEDPDDSESSVKSTLKSEVDQLRSSIKDAERRYRDEYIQSTLQIRDAYELLDRTRSESSHKEGELETKLKESRSEAEELRAKLIASENALQINSNSGEVENLKANLLKTEEMLLTMTEENKELKQEMVRAESEALMKIDSLLSEGDKSSKKAARAMVQLDAAEASNSELEAELRRLKVQCNQWRKAAEAAAAMLAAGNGGKCVERGGSFDYHSIWKKVGYAYEDADDDSPKRKNGNMLKKIGVLLKKGQK